MASRFSRPETKLLTLGNGDTLTVKKRLSAGEQRAEFGRMYLAGVDGTLKVNPFATGIALVTAYLLDWSLADDLGKPVVIRDLSIEDLTAVLDSLDPDSFTEIKEAIETHEAAMAAERQQEKKASAGAPV